MIDGKSQPLLRRFWPNVNDHISNTYTFLYYKNVTRSEVRDIEFYIIDENGQLASFLTKTVTVTLHLRAYPFYS